MKPKKKDNWLPCEPYEFKLVTDPDLIKLIDNDPYFIKKHEEAQKFIDKYGIPKELLENKK